MKLLREMPGSVSDKDISKASTHSENESTEDTATNKHHEVIVMDDLLKELAKLREENLRLKSETTMDATGKQSSKMWIATIYDPKGKVMLKRNTKGKWEPLEKHFDKASQADRWSDLRLVTDGYGDSYATIGHQQMRTMTTVNRNDAMGRCYGKQPGKPGQMQPTKPNPEHQPLGFKPKVKQTRVEFSRG